MTSINIAVKKLQHFGDMELPSYATQGSAGMDLTAAINEDIVIPPMGRMLIPTGISIAIPQGYEGQIRPRSGLAFKSGIGVPNSPGTIDADYRGEVCVPLINFSDKDFIITRGMRIAQLIISKHEHVIWNQTEELPTTSRGEGGFGSTGVLSHLAS